MIGEKHVQLRSYRLAHYSGYILYAIGHSPTSQMMHLLVLYTLNNRHEI